MTRLALLAIALAACEPAAPTTSTPRTPSAPTSEAPKVDLADHHAAYVRATELAMEGSLVLAIAKLEPFARATEGREDIALAYWIHNQLTWLRWGQGDLRGALAETEAGARALDHSKLPPSEVESMRLHALWDRAYLLLELHDARAHEAFDAYASLARAKDDHDGLAVLTAFFAARENRASDAARAAHEVDVEHDADLQDLYVIALALDAAGDRERAAAVRTRICTAEPYLMKPLLVRQMAREGFRCP